MENIQYEFIDNNLIYELKTFIRYQYMLFSYDDIQRLELELSHYCLTLKKYLNYLHNNQAKFSRAYKRIKYFRSNYKYLAFVTLTFNDNNISSYESKFNYFRKKILDKNIEYIFNIDFGSINERVHYHGIIASNYEINKNNFIWCYGFSDIKQIRFNEKNTLRYLIKLNRHSFKDSTNKRLIYSRKRF